MWGGELAVLNLIAIDPSRMLGRHLAARLVAQAQSGCVGQPSIGAGTHFAAAVLI